MSPLVILAIVTVSYAGYNILIKQSGAVSPETATTSILATMVLQTAAFSVSLIFLTFLTIQGGQSFRLSTPTYFWAVLAGLCIGTAEIGYFYLFGGHGGVPAMRATVAIPTIVCGTIVLTMIAGYFFFKEAMGWPQFAGAGLVAVGIALLFRQP